MEYPDVTAQFKLDQQATGIIMLSECNNVASRFPVLHIISTDSVITNGCTFVQVYCSDVLTICCNRVTQVEYTCTNRFIFETLDYLLNGVKHLYQPRFLLRNRWRLKKNMFFSDKYPFSLCLCLRIFTGGQFVNTKCVEHILRI